MTKQEEFANAWAREIAQGIEVDLPLYLVERHLSAAIQTAFEGMMIAVRAAKDGAMLRDFGVIYDVHL